MRTTKRFTPEVLDRFKREGRGSGAYQEYVPWHRVGRGDPSSRGRSHLLNWNGRQRELLSDQEWHALLFSTQLNLRDVREQFPLTMETGGHEMAAYTVSCPSGAYRGTIEIARDLRVKHPICSANGVVVLWVMTTDLLMYLDTRGGSGQLLAVAVKCARELSRKRTTELLTIEQHYWRERGVEWLCVTEDCFDRRVALTLRNSQPWALGSNVGPEELVVAATIAEWEQGQSLTRVLRSIAKVLGELERAQRAFWQAVWRGKIPLDLRRQWRPHLPVVLLSHEEFLSLNPIAMRRSAWTAL